MTVTAPTASPPRRPPEPPAARVREFVTPEGVDLRLRIADAAERAAAYVLDVVFINAALLLLFLAAIGAMIALHTTGAGEVAFVIWNLVSFFISNAYFIVLELTPRAATFGKRIMGIRVVARDGGRLTSEAIFIRNAMREIELTMPFRLWVAAAFGGGGGAAVGWLFLVALVWVGVFLFFPLFNRDRLRVGDFVAGTWVVKAPRERLSIDLLDAVEAGQAYAFTTEQTGAYGVKELHVLEDVLRRKDRQTLAAVAQRIRAKILWREIAGETDTAFLAAYYGALRARLENQLLFGRRRKDKFDVG
jgi:uncharacterized RDD family membrane protein YckC